MKIYKMSEYITRETKKLSRKKCKIKADIDGMKMTYKDTGFIDVTKKMQKEFRELKIEMIEAQQEELNRLRKVYKKIEKLKEESTSIINKEVRPRTFRVARIGNIHDKMERHGVTKESEAFSETHREEVEVLEKEVKPGKERLEVIEQDLQSLKQELKGRYNNG